MSWERAMALAFTYNRAIAEVKMIVLGHRTSFGWVYHPFIKDHPDTNEVRFLPPRERR